MLEKNVTHHKSSITEDERGLKNGRSGQVSCLLPRGFLAQVTLVLFEDISFKKLNNASLNSVITFLNRLCTQYVPFKIIKIYIGKISYLKILPLAT